MRRMVAVRRDDGGERTFDVRALQSGDAVEVFDDDLHGWVRGTYRVTTAGDALVELQTRAAMSFGDALAAGLRRLAR